MILLSIIAKNKTIYFVFKILGNLTILHINNHNIENLEKDIFSDSLSVGKLERLHLVNGKLLELHVESFQV